MGNIDLLNKDEISKVVGAEQCGCYCETYGFIAVTFSEEQCRAICSNNADKFDNCPERKSALKAPTFLYSDGWIAFNRMARSASRGLIVKIDGS